MALGGLGREGHRFCQCCSQHRCYPFKCKAGTMCFTRSLRAPTGSCKACKSLQIGDTFPLLPAKGVVRVLRIVMFVLQGGAHTAAARSPGGVGGGTGGVGEGGGGGSAQSKAYEGYNERSHLPGLDYFSIHACDIHQHAMACPMVCLTHCRTLSTDLEVGEDATVAGQVAAAKEGAGATGAAATAAAPAGEGAGACMCAQRQNSTGQSIREAFGPAAHIFSLQQLAAARQSAHVSPAATARALAAVCALPAVTASQSALQAGLCICTCECQMLCTSCCCTHGGGLNQGQAGSCGVRGPGGGGGEGPACKEQGAVEATSLSELRCGCAMLVLACIHGDAKFYGLQERLASTTATGI